MAQYTVTAPLVSAFSVDGRCLYFYAGAPMDDAGLRAGEAKRLADAGLIVADEVPVEGSRRRGKAGDPVAPVVVDGAVVFTDDAASVKG